jgi:2-phospho-L-lactate guanylyltransferase
VSDIAGSGRVTALIPVKRLAEAKGRLASRLSPIERRRLVLACLDHVLDTLRGCRDIDRVAVVSPDAQILRRARDFGAIPLDEARLGASGHNQALEAARSVLLRGAATPLSPEELVRERGMAASGDVPLRHAAPPRGDRTGPPFNRDGRTLPPQALDASGPGLARPSPSLLVVSADLPWLRAADVSALVAIAGTGRSVVIAPDRSGEGTNALLLSPFDAIPFRFGAGSRRAHAAEAEASKSRLCYFQADGTANDVDEPADLDRLRGIGPLVGFAAAEAAGGGIGGPG